MKIILEILRYKAETRNSFWESFTLEGNGNTSVVELLLSLNDKNPLKTNEGEISRKIDFEHSCNQKQCGGCAMVIDDIPRLACATFVKDLQREKKHKGSEGYLRISLKPLSKFPVIQDLKVDRSVMYEQAREMKLWMGENMDNRKTLKKNELLYDSASCLMCGCCLEVCPNYSKGSDFFGMQMIHMTNKILIKEGNPQKKRELKKLNKKHGTSHCSKSLGCEKVCPAGIPLSAHLANLCKWF